MRKADFKASIKKIELGTKSTTDGWGENIRVTLGDIELTNENLVEIRQFKPNEPIKVTFEPVQINLFETVPDAITGEKFIELEENQSDPPKSAVLKTFNLND